MKTLPRPVNAPFPYIAAAGRVDSRFWMVFSFKNRPDPRRIPLESEFRPLFGRQSPVRPDRTGQ